MGEARYCLIAPPKTCDGGSLGIFQSVPEVSSSKISDGSVTRCKSQTTRQSEFRFHAMLGDGTREIHFERVTRYASQGWKAWITGDEHNPHTSPICTSALGWPEESLRWSWYRHMSRPFKSGKMDLLNR
jgi:hypothetical protein